MNQQKKLKYIKWTLIIISGLITINQFLQALSTKATFQLIFNPIFLIGIIYYLIKDNKGGYHLCFILGYGNLFLKILGVSLLPRLLEGRILLFIVDTLIILIFIGVTHLGYRIIKQK